MILWWGAAIGMDTRYFQSLDQSLSSLFTTRIGIERQNNLAHMRRKPISTDSRACQGHHLTWFHPSAEQSQPIKCTFNQRDVSRELIWIIAEPASRVGLDPAPRRSWSIQQGFVRILIHSRHPLPQCA